LPRSRYAGDLGLAAEFSLGADFTRYPRNFGRKAVELVHHRIDGFLELEDFAFDVDGDLAGEVPAANGSGHLGNVSDLPGEIRRHEVDVVREVLPGTGHAPNHRLTTQLAFGADFARYPRHFRGEPVELIHHGVEGVFEFQDLTLDVHRDFLGKIPIGHR